MSNVELCWVSECLCVKFICFGFPNDCSILGLLELRHQIILSDRPTGCPQTQLQNELSFLQNNSCWGDKREIDVNKIFTQIWPRSRVSCVTVCGGPSIRNPLLSQPGTGQRGNINYKTSQHQLASWLTWLASSGLSVFGLFGIRKTYLALITTLITCIINYISYGSFSDRFVVNKVSWHSLYLKGINEDKLSKLK